jgi:hypothetical protein
MKPKASFLVVFLGFFSFALPSRTLGLPRESGKDSGAPPVNRSFPAADRQRTTLPAVSGLFSAPVPAPSTAAASATVCPGSSITAPGCIRCGTF